MTIDMLNSIKMEVLSRLFNHKPAAQGEISYLVQEFDAKKRKDEEILQEIWKTSNNIQKNVLPSTLQLVSEHLTHLQAKVSVCSRMCERISTVGNTSLKKDVNVEENLDNITIYDDEFLKNLEESKDCVNKEFNDAVTKLIKDYEEMEKQVERENSSLLQ